MVKCGGEKRTVKKVYALREIVITKYIRLQVKIAGLLVRCVKFTQKS